tara:strand:+ start:308 stop:796 length:489 start_codon:yes stop_codon:yes gene_type:complete
MGVIKNKKVVCLFIIILIFLLDRISKLYILNIAETSGSVDININSYLNFILIWNRGIGFGLLSFEQSLVYIITTLVILIINLIIIYLVINTNDFKAYFFALILGGSLGNLFDRIYYTAVPDFIDLNYKGFHWFVFNVADIFITIGIICLIFAELINYKKKND